MNGTCAILNVAAGDTALTFDNSNPAETIRSARIVRDMIRRGYALLVEVERDGEKRFERALDFDEAHCRYIIADFDPHQSTVERELSRPLADIAIDKGMEYDHGESITPETAPSAESTGKSRRGRPKRTSVEASTTRAVAVGRSAGG